MRLCYVVGEFDSFDNIKELLKVRFEVSDRLLAKLKRADCILVNGVVCGVRAQVCAGDVVEVLIDFEEDNSNIVSVDIGLDILYEDECLLVVNKPAGIPVHPSILHYEDSLSNGIRYYFDSINLHKKIRPVNRLDRDTSGIVVFAKNEYIQECLIRQMKNHTFVKEYIALCEGVFENKTGTINAPIGRKSGSIIERCVRDDGDVSITHYDVIDSNSEYSKVHVVLETGRTHQIRVHFAYIGHPILGDTLYGKPSSLVSRQALHCWRMSFVHPISKELISLEAELTKKDGEFGLF